MPPTTRTAKPAKGRGRGGAKAKVSNPGAKAAPPKKAEPIPKTRVSKRKRASTSLENIPDIDTPPSPPKNSHPRLVVVNSPPKDPVLQAILEEEEEILKLIHQKEARERLQRLKAQLGEEGNSNQGASVAPGTSAQTTTVSAPPPVSCNQGNAQVYAQMQAQVATPPAGGGGWTTMSWLWQ